MNALKLLEKDHENVFKLFGRFRATHDVQKRLKLFKEIRVELEVHTHIEQTVFYPAIFENDELKYIIFEEVEEDRKLQIVLDSISSIQHINVEFEKKINQMMNGVEHHILNENKIFLQINEVLNQHELEEIGAELEAEKLDYINYQ